MAATQILPERYQDVHRLAQGAMGDIYRATDTTLDRVVAVKLLAQPYLADEAARRRFAREARAAARVSGDPNIVTIFDVGDAGRPYIVMEYVDGTSLEERLRSGRVPPDDALRWIEQAGRALDYAHSHGVVHRDVKPGNLLLDRADNVHVADFGIASAAWMPSLTAAGTILGTAGYLAPEQALGEQTSAASDRYALAVVAYELLTGRRPFARESPTAEAQAHVTEPVPSVSVGSPRSDALDSVFARALAKQPENRYATCAEFASALRAAFRDAPTSPGARTAVTAPLTRPTRTRRTSGPRWPLVVALLGLVAAGAVVAAVALSSSSSSPRTAAPPRARTHAKATTAAHTIAPTTTTPGTTAARSAPAASPQQLNDQAWSLMKQGRYSEALPLLQQAVPALGGAGPGDPYEGYANYNLGYTLLQLGRCSEALPYLQHAQALEPQRSEVADAVAGVQQCLAPAENGNNGKHKGRHKKAHD